MHVDCGTLVDGDGRVLEDARFRVEDGTIVEAGPREEIDTEGDRIDHSGAVVVPGFVDAHVHMQGLRTMDPRDWALADETACAARATADCRRLLEAGFTAVRDLGSSVALGLREAVESGDVPGPRIYTSGRSISQTGGHGDAHFLPYEWSRGGGLGISELADGPDECRKTARKRIREGVDCLKIMTTGGVLSEKDSPGQAQYTDAEIRAFTEEADRVGIPVASHAQGTEGVLAALDNGVDTIEHGFYLDDAAVERLLETDATLVPTLAIMFRIVEEGADHGVPEYGLRKAEEAFEAHVESTRRAYEAGVPVATGTDFLGPELIPHGENALELELLVEEIGLSPVEAVEAATGVAGRTVPDDVGALTPGAHADFVVLGSDPRDGIEAVRDVETVYRAGERVVPDR
ncbi:amidohydrolase family protein [Natronomonas salina]|uniref:metal-dependent hydrolase family protein n=1 Tax=Natronomonas salina TaxID=1710540 RepID=UPI0015B5BC86|nr:amidohydrolase family protein [Natronomonas salina]QLD89728.1 amidohydrolase family protein [Natronomonas salina]